MVASAQYNVTHYQTFSGGTQGAAVTAATLTNGLVGASMAWAVVNQNSGMTFDTNHFVPMIGAITVNGVTTNAMVNGFAMKVNSAETPSVYFTATPQYQTTSMSIGCWLVTDFPDDVLENHDFFTVQGGGVGQNSFVNPPWYGDQATTLKLLWEACPGSPVVSDSILFHGGLTNRYWITEGYNIGSTNWNFVSIYLNGTNLVGTMKTNYNMPQLALYGVVGSHSTGSYPSSTNHFWFSNFVMNTNGVFPLLPGTPSVAASTTLNVTTLNVDRITSQQP
jgi:hypothetical protein